ncbi:MAG: GH25 family lysozyme [Eubacterium sp.]|nr:GH25 family lysozyme [Eubacterium sp.]
MTTLKEKLLTKRNLIIAAGAAAAVLVAVVLYFAITIGATRGDYVKGVDVSAYQGDIDWKKLASQDITFAYIKATEGADHEDSKFDTNWAEAKKTGLKVGAYHFVNFDQDGKTQAEHFIQKVPKDDDSLPPVIDLELYGDYLEKPMDKDKVQAILNDMIIRLEEYYGKTPIIYTNYNTYNTYLADAFAEISIWICDISSQEPELEAGHQWIFWQYSQRELLNGYEGEERFIDMNIFNGTMKEFKETFD